jgi:hypothetical protein
MSFDAGQLMSCFPLVLITTWLFLGQLCREEHVTLDSLPNRVAEISVIFSFYHFRFFAKCEKKNLILII